MFDFELKKIYVVWICSDLISFEFVLSFELYPLCYALVGEVVLFLWAFDLMNTEKFGERNEPSAGNNG